MGRIVAASKLLVVGKLSLDLVELVLAQDGRNLGHGDPLGLISQRMASRPTSDWSQGRLSMSRLRLLVAAKEHRSRVNRIGENATDRGLIPTPAATGSGNMLGDQAFGYSQ